MAHIDDKTERLAAIETVVNTYEAALLRYATRLVFKSDLAQDIVQDAFLRLFRKWKDAMEPSPQLSSWLYRVTHNIAIDYMRKSQRRQLLHQKHADERVEHTPANRGEGFRISEDAARAAAAMQRLSTREQQLVILKVYEEKSYKEISDITSLTVGNVGYILHHAMKKMARTLKREADPEPSQNKAQP